MFLIFALFYHLFPSDMNPLMNSSVYYILREEPNVVRIGDIDLSTPDEGSTFEIAQTYVHPEYNRGRAYHDIALIQFHQKLGNPAKIRPPCLWPSNDLAGIENPTAAGYGLTSPRKLIPIFSNQYILLYIY